MILENYIKELLYRYDCVIVPNFGGFVCNNKSATIKGNTFNPPYKQLTFNTLLQTNDGLLANYIASTDKMPYETAVNFINFEVEMWIEKLVNNDLDLKGIGSFTLENDTVLFEPDSNENYLTSSFGLKSYVADVISRVSNEKVIKNQPAIYRPQVAQIEEKVVLKLQPKTTKKYNFLKYAAIFVLTTSIVGALGVKMYQKDLENKQIVKLQEQQKQRENQIQTATFVIPTHLPAITLNTAVPIDKYYIIAGAFRSKKNARKKVRQLIRKGFDAKIIGKNKWNLTQVAFNSFPTLKEANKTLSIIQHNIASDAWLFIKK